MNLSRFRSKTCRCLFGLSFGTLLLLGCATTDNALEQSGTGNIASEVWSIVFQKYYRSDFGGIDWIGQAKQTAQSIQPSMSSESMDQIVKAMLAVLNDQHTFYLTPEEVEEREAKGYEGVGFSTNEHPTEPGLKIVVRVLPESPAEKVGIREGWLYLGKEGTVYRFLDDYQRVCEFALEQTYIEHQRLDRSSKWLDKNILYVRLDRFDEGCALWTRKTVENASQARGIILDLRWNPGGRVSELQAFSGCFFPNFTLLGIETSRSHREKFLRVDGSDGKYFKGAIVVLIGEYSASSSEIFARAVQYHKRGSIVGDSASAGQVLISPSWQLSNGGMLFVSAKDFMGPDGKRIQDIGIHPDHRVEKRSLFNLRKGNDPVLDKAISMLSE